MKASEAASSVLLEWEAGIGFGRGQDVQILEGGQGGNFFFKKTCGVESHWDF